MRTNEALDSLPDMAVFARVVAAGSFSGAARTLGLTPSAVSRQVARLEGVLRVRLLERTTRRLRLTAAGHAAHARCMALEAAAREVLQLADAHHGATPQGLVRMSAPKAYARQRIHPLVAPFLAAHPQVDVQLVVTDRVVDLFGEDIDLAIRITDAPPPGLAGRPLEAVEHIVCASPAYLERRGTPRHPRDLAGHDCICLGEDAHDRRWRFARGAGRAAEQATVAVRGRYAANHSEMRRDAALAGLGIASLPGFAARAALESGALVRVLAGWRHDTAYSGTAWLLYPPNRFLPPRTRAWIDHVAAGLATEAGSPPKSR
ncbi:LysR family transcriptional regulator [Paracidovorax anthurii]|uniref:DNA-binding transcriptional LysR family regulator n=1 Tax=Paracidovorax anthurii TaxID=78229 RepID=A0A328ZS97_9BURK|nr:LysR family transcriptional regulator [Paracidovorax anthurii]RAR85146.1 DNA-binding transcriptional LysR family regulator [Paracidovorax anthurii]